MYRYYFTLIGFPLSRTVIYLSARAWVTIVFTQDQQTKSTRPKGTGGPRRGFKWVVLAISHSWVVLTTTHSAKGWLPVPRKTWIYPPFSICPRRPCRRQAQRGLGRNTEAKSRGCGHESPLNLPNGKLSPTAEWLCRLQLLTIAPWVHTF